MYKKLHTWLVRGGPGGYKVPGPGPFLGARPHSQGLNKFKSFARPAWPRNFFCKSMATLVSAGASPEQGGEAIDLLPDPMKVCSQRKCIRISQLPPLPHPPNHDKCCRQRPWLALKLVFLRKELSLLF